MELQEIGSEEVANALVSVVLRQQNTKTGKR
jgi:hypothetical protein